MMGDNVEKVDFRKKEGIEDASNKVLESAKAATAQYIDNSIDIESTLVDVDTEAGEVVVDTMNASEQAMCREMAALGVQIKKDLDSYLEKAETNLRQLLEDDPEKLSAYLVKQALYQNVDRTLVNRLCRNKELYDLLRKTMFWRIQERTGVFDYILAVRSGFQVVKVDPVSIMQVGDAVERLKRMAMLRELENSNHPPHLKTMIRQILETTDL